MSKDYENSNYPTAGMAPLATLTASSEKVPEHESSVNPPDNANDTPDVNNEDEYASGMGLLLLIISLMLGMFLVALDNVGSSSLLICYNFRD
jgi:hypothetical protein